MLDAELCRRYARNFLMRSRQLKDAQTKAAMIEIAVYWTQLAIPLAEAEPRPFFPDNSKHQLEQEPS
jgi:hypothetical protein